MGNISIELIINILTIKKERKRAMDTSDYSRFDKEFDLINCRRGA